MSAELLPLSELPWWWVLIDESHIYDGETATLAPQYSIPLDGTAVRPSYNHMVTCTRGGVPPHTHTHTAALRCARARQYKHSQHRPTCKRTLTRSVSMIWDTYWASGLCPGSTRPSVKASRTHTSFLIRINGKKRLADVYQYRISVWCNKQTERVPPPPSPSHVNWIKKAQRESVN